MSPLHDVEKAAETVVPPQKEACLVAVVPELTGAEIEWGLKSFIPNLEISGFLLTMIYMKNSLARFVN